MKGLCKYKDIFGQVGKGVHFHIAGIAVVDTALTILAAWVISLVYQPIKNNKILSYLVILLILMCFAIFFHWLFCVPTKTTLWINNLTK